MLVYHPGDRILAVIEACTHPVRIEEAVPPKAAKTASIFLCSSCIFSAAMQRGFFARSLETASIFYDARAFYRRNAKVFRQKLKNGLDFFMLLVNFAAVLCPDAGG